MNKIDISGMRFGMLVAIHPAESKGKRRWFCKCDCGGSAIIAQDHLRSGHTKSCSRSCWSTLNPPSRTHGFMDKNGDPRKRRLYKVWVEMKNRCSNPNDPSYKRYGGRGIRVCKEWQIFENFFSDMGMPPAGGSIERKDNNGDYCKQNCRWATPKEQAANRRVRVDARIFEFGGKKAPLAECCRRAGLKWSTVYNRLLKGVNGENLFAPPRPKAKAI